ncbi:MAG: OB-fold domain-containing protein [Gammaproteobacteria bacterium]|nr:OB-fold domain-containing protein [Gammaproteobacteria bacterium]
MAGITAFGGYVPRLRLEHKAIADAHSWYDPSVAKRAKAERSMCNWDEDSITMAVEAARDCLQGINSAPTSLYLASTSLPFSDRQNAGIVVEALHLGEATAVMDVTASQRAGTSALMQALDAATGTPGSQRLVIGSEHRKSRAGSPQELNFGDGACALLVADQNPLLEYIGGHAITVDFVDHFRAEHEDYDYPWEDRWIRDEGYAGIAPRAVQGALEKHGLRADQIDHLIMPGLAGKAAGLVAKKSGIAAEAAYTGLHTECGDTGSAHALVMLAHALEGAVKPGERVMVVGFGQGCDVLLFKATPALASYRPGTGIRGALANRQAETSYQKFLTFNDTVEWEKGMRGERDNRTALTVLYRKRGMLLGLVGGRCTACGTPQIPQGDICVNPECHADSQLEPYNFREERAKILSWSADYLTFTKSPPSHYGMITFDNGGRFMTDFTDVEPGEIEVGDPVRMVFRIKAFDTQRGFVRYFWKAVPVRDTQDSGER